MLSERRFIVVATRGQDQLPLWVDEIVGDEIIFRGAVSAHVDDAERMTEEDAKQVCRDAMNAYQKRLRDQAEPPEALLLSDLQPNNLEFFFVDADELPEIFPKLSAEETAPEDYERRRRLRQRLEWDEYLARDAARMAGSRRPTRSTLRLMIGISTFLLLEYGVVRPLMDHLFLAHTSIQDGILNCTGGSQFGDCEVEDGVRAYDSTWWALLGNTTRLVLSAVAVGIAFSVRKLGDRWSVEGRERKIM